MALHIKDCLKTTGTVIKVHKCWYIKVNQKPVRTHALDGAAFPHIITVEYEVDGQKYTKKKFFNYNITCPKVGSNVDVYYDRENPKKIFLKMGDISMNIDHMKNTKLILEEMTRLLLS